MFCIFGLALLVDGSAIGQGNFVNLDFERARLIVAGSLPWVYASSALPGWTALVGTVNGGSQSQSEIFYNVLSLGAPYVSIHDDNSNYPDLVIAGRFTVVLQSGVLSPSVGGVMPAEIAQTGTVPPTTQSLRFLGNGFGNLSVSLGGNLLQLHALETTSQGTVYGANISPWAGQTMELRFSTFGTYFDPFTQISLDNIQFSPQAIPEPSIAGVISLALLYFRFGGFLRFAGVSAETN